MEKETYIYAKSDDATVTCLTCMRECIIANGEKGWCGTRINRHGTLYSLTYGEVASLAINPIEKKPVFHYYPGSRWLSAGSVGCNFRCPGCQNWNISHWRDGGMNTQYVSPEELVIQATLSGCTGISWTFNEPTIWFEYTYDTARIAISRGLHTNYVTNGFISERAFDMIAPYLDVFRVDVKGFSKRAYQRLCHTEDYRCVLERAEKAAQCGMHVEIVTNIIPGFNDGSSQLRNIATWIKNSLGADTPWHVTRFYPHHELMHISATPVSTLEHAWMIGRAEGLRYVYLGNVPGHKWENTYCHECGTLLIKRSVFDIVENNVENGMCPECNTIIPGTFN